MTNNSNINKHTYKKGLLNKFINQFPAFLLIVFILSQVLWLLLGFPWSMLDYPTIIFSILLIFLYQRLDKGILNKTFRISAKYLWWFMLLFMVRAILNFLPSLYNSMPLFNIEMLLFAILMVFLLRDLKNNNIKYKYVLFLILIIPAIIHVTGIAFGLLYLPFLPEVEVAETTGLLGMLDMFEEVHLNPFSSIYDSFPTLVGWLRDFIFAVQSKTTPYWKTFLSYPVISLMVLFWYSLFHFFKQNNYNPYLSFVPVANVLVLAKICNAPLLWKILLFVPFVRFYYFYKINKILAERYALSKWYIIAMTVFPFLFYGKLIYK